MKHTLLLLYQTRPLRGTGIQVVLLINGMAAAIARETLPHDALRKAHPRERSLEDLRLEQPELIVGCWASG